MKINVLDYKDFYFKHSSQHFIQFDDYSSSKKRSFVKIFASLILNIWSKYTIVYKFDFIMKHEIVIMMNKDVRENIFKLRLMNVLDFQNKYYIEFLKKSNELNCRFNIDDWLNINFILLVRSKKTNWQALIIDVFSCTSLKNVCVNMYRFRDFEIEAYSTQTINALSCNIVDINTTFQRVQRHFCENVEVNVVANDKIFRRQFIELQKLHKEESCRWWKNICSIKL
jgi:hypothetical protein